MKRFLCSVVFLSLFFVSTHARADVISVTASPSQRNIAVGDTTTFTVIWTVSHTTTISAGGVTVFSPSGTFSSITPPTTLSTVPELLTKSGRPATGTTTFREVVRVRTSTVTRARDLNQTAIAYLRTFDDGEGDDIGFVMLPITGSNAAGFSISRMVLSFDDDSPLRVVARSSKLGAKAQFRFGGSGMLEGLWEVAQPGSVEGTAVYRPLQREREFFGVQDEKTLVSPVLPTVQTGLHLVRFRVTSPESTFETPVIRYFVSAKQAGGPTRDLQTMHVLGPRPFESLKDDTRFAWREVSGAKAYQLEIFISAKVGLDPEDVASQDSRDSSESRLLPQGRPISGMLLPSEDPGAVLSLLARVHLESGRTYLWRVRAIAEDGSIVGESPMHAIRVP